MINVRFSENEILISTSSFITGIRRKIKIILLYIIVFLSCFFLKFTNSSSEKFMVTQIIIRYVDDNYSIRREQFEAFLQNY